MLQIPLSFPSKVVMTFLILLLCASCGQSKTVSSHYFATNTPSPTSVNGTFPTHEATQQDSNSNGFPIKLPTSSFKMSSDGEWVALIRPEYAGEQKVENLVWTVELVSVSRTKESFFLFSPDERSNYPLSVSFSPDGKKLAVHHHRGSVWIYDTSNWSKYQIQDWDLQNPQSRKILVHLLWKMPER